ncbi:hypothetical protein MKW92_016349 [Papaver armeniacum]|nr:hypothetical protein MKW92_016349 [Papaver armeniacum]
MVKKMRSSSVTGRVPEFFKIFFSPESFNKMKIPVEFLEQLTCEIHGIFSLLGPSGKVWRVRYLRWVMANWLQVQIFEQNGCEKESAFEANCNQESTTNCSARRWGKMAMKNQGKFPIFKGRASTMNRSARSWGEKGNERLGGPLISRRRDITVEEENMPLDAALGFVSTNPYTMITISALFIAPVKLSCNMVNIDCCPVTSICLLMQPLPRPFCKEHLPDHSQDMTLRVPRGEVWGVRFYMNQTHQIGQLTVGWRKVSFTNNIEASDVCIFELVRPDEFKLHIFRVVEEITPLKRQRDI